jgi:hypothetical protein
MSTNHSTCAANPRPPNTARMRSKTISANTGLPSVFVDWYAAPYPSARRIEPLCRAASAQVRGSKFGFGDVVRKPVDRTMSGYAHPDRLRRGPPREGSRGPLRCRPRQDLDRISPPVEAPLPRPSPRVATPWDRGSGVKAVVSPMPRPPWRWCAPGPRDSDFPAAPKSCRTTTITRAATVARRRWRDEVAPPRRFVALRRVSRRFERQRGPAL